MSSLHAGILNYSRGMSQVSIMAHLGLPARHCLNHPESAGKRHERADPSTCEELSPSITDVQS